MRSIWKGAISFGLVTIPVKLYSATEEKNVAFHQVHRDDGSLVWSTTVTARTYTGFPGGALYAQTPIGDCSSVPGTTDNDYVIAYDTGSGRWSARLPIDSDCASF